MVRLPLPPGGNVRIKNASHSGASRSFGLAHAIILPPVLKIVNSNQDTFTIKLGQ